MVKKTWKKIGIHKNKKSTSILEDVSIFVVSDDQQSVVKIFVIYCFKCSQNILYLVRNNTRNKDVQLSHIREQTSNKSPGPISTTGYYYYS